MQLKYLSALVGAASAMSNWADVGEKMVFNNGEVTLELTNNVNPVSLIQQNLASSVNMRDNNIDTFETQRWIWKDSFDFVLAKVTIVMDKFIDIQLKDGTEADLIFRKHDANDFCTRNLKRSGGWDLHSAFACHSVSFDGCDHTAFPKGLDRQSGVKNSYEAIYNSAVNGYTVYIQQECRKKNSPFFNASETRFCDGNGSFSTNLDLDNAC